MTNAALTRVELRNFTAFADLALDLSPGINVFIGTNSTGKTHLLKVLYAACDVSRLEERTFADKLGRVFMPSQGSIGRLVRRQKGGSSASVTVHRGADNVSVTFANQTQRADKATTAATRWSARPMECAYIPVKEMLAHAPGFRSLYETREIHFEEIYADLVTRAYLPKLRGPIDENRGKLLKIIQEQMQGTVFVQGEEFFLRSSAGNLEFSLLAEGLRKLALIWLLIQNGTLLSGSVLFWDEPETNLNPAVMGTIAEILLELRRLGVQIFAATHDYAFLKELALRASPEEPVAYHALFRPAAGEGVSVSTSATLDEVHPNAIRETFLSIFDREAARDFGG
ncbi:AAA family ATPase [Sorangium sp. So ce131]|uniref:AAA family ATPase n=1 Tax=Sorangium sp. So ce131 TaxID=3133282 RepID=UPI003F5F2AF7